jgi:hypothetical protein
VRRGPLALAVLLCLIGTVWLLQGINVLPGSVMSGDPFWAWVGAGLWLVALGLVYLTHHR